MANSRKDKRGYVLRTDECQRWNDKILVYGGCRSWIKTDGFGYPKVPNDVI